MSGKNIIIILVGIMVLGGLMAAFLGNKKDVLPQTALKNSDWKRGAVNSKVSLIEYGDFQCPACAAYEPVIQKLQENFKDDLIFSYRHFPLSQIHQNALPSAKASEAAGLQNKFWEMHYLLYKTQLDWSLSTNPKEIFIDYAKTLELDIAKFERDLKLSSIDEKIKSDFVDGTKLGIQGTPTFFLNGKKIENPRSYEDLKKIIESATENNNAQIKQ